MTTTTMAAPVTSTATPPTGRSTTTTTQPATSVTPGLAPTTFSNAGGSITVTCQGSAVVLKSAVPADGFQVTVQSGGPQEALVRFTGSGGAVFLLGARCQNGTVIRMQPSAGPNSASGPSESG